MDAPQDDGLSASIVQEHLATRRFTSVDWIEERTAAVLQDALDPLISPQPAYGHYATELHGTLLSAIPPEAAQNPSYDDIAIEQRTERLVTGLMGLMDPDDQERDVRKVIWSGGRMRAGGVKAYGGDVPPYRPKDRPLVPPLLSRKAQKALPRLGPLRGERLESSTQLTAPDGRFSFIKKVKVRKSKVEDFDRAAAAGQDIAVDPQVLRAAKAWRKPLLRSCITALQAHDHPLEKMPRWREWENRSKRDIKDAAMTPYIPLLPRRRPYRPPRHTVPTEPFDVPRLGAKVAGAETRSMVDLALVEDEENEGAGWDDVAAPPGIEHYTQDLVLQLKHLRRLQAEYDKDRLAREMRWEASRIEAEQAEEQYPDDLYPTYSAPAADRPLAPADANDPPTIDTYSAYAPCDSTRYTPLADDIDCLSANPYATHGVADGTCDRYIADDHGPMPVHAQHYSSPGLQAERYFYQHPQSSPVSYSSGVMRTAPARSTDTVPCQLPPIQLQRLPQAHGKRKRWEDSETLRQLALRRRSQKVSAPSRATDTGATRSNADQAYSARAHLDEHLMLVQGITSNSGTTGDPFNATGRGQVPMQTLDEPELDEEEALVARRKREAEEREAARQAALAPPPMQEVDLTNPIWYKKACFLARSLGTQPIEVLASVKLFQNRPLVEALQARGLDILDEDVDLGGADLVPWATVGVLFRRLADVGGRAVKDELRRAVSRAALFYERVVVVLEVTSYAAPAKEDQLMDKMEALEDEEDDALQAVREPNTPRRPGNTQGQKAASSAQVEAVDATSNIVKVSPAVQDALARLRQLSSTLTQPQVSLDRNDNIASKIDLVFAHDGAAEVAGAIRAIAEREERTKLGKTEGSRTWLQVEPDGDEAALIGTFCINPFASRLLLDRHRPLQVFVKDTGGEGMVEALKRLLGERGAKRFVKILEEHKQARRQQQDSRQYYPVPVLQDPYYHPGNFQQDPYVHYSPSVVQDEQYHQDSHHQYAPYQAFPGISPGPEYQ